MPSTLINSTRHDVYPFIDPAEGLAGAAAGKTVLIADGGTTIGHAIAVAFAEAGASTLIIAAPNPDPLEATKAYIEILTSGRCHVLAMGHIEASDDACVTRLFDTIAKQLGQPPDIVVSNATTANRIESVQEIDPFTWWTSIDVNLRGTYHIARNYFAALRLAGKMKAHIIIISSHPAKSLGQDTSPYSIPKAALARFHDIVENESSSESMPEIACIVMHPGRNVEWMGKQPSEEIISTMIDKPALAGATAVYLTTDRAVFLQGRFLDASWDMEELEKLKQKLDDENLLRIKSEE